MSRRASCGCVWERTDPDSYDGECAVGVTPASATTPTITRATADGCQSSATNVEVRSERRGED